MIILKNLSKFVSNASRGMASSISSLLARVSAASSTGKTLNVESYGGSELRELKVMLPYGVSSSVPDDVLVQVIINGVSNTVVGCHDSDRPSAKPGEVIIYSKSGASIKLDINGGITLVTKSGHSVSVDDIYQHLQS